MHMKSIKNLLKDSFSLLIRFIAMHMKSIKNLFKDSFSLLKIQKVKKMPNERH